MKSVLIQEDSFAIDNIVGLVEPAAPFCLEHHDGIQKVPEMRELKPTHRTTSFKLSRDSLIVLSVKVPQLIQAMEMKHMSTFGDK